MILGAIILGLVTLQRAGELALSHYNTRRLLRKGAVEIGAGHYPLIVGLHLAWLLGLWWLAPGREVAMGWLSVFVVLQGLRIWVLLTLRERWTTRIIILPGAPLIKHGPFRILPHPNYAVVAGEIAVLPLAFDLFWFALIFSLLNAAVLALRIRIENRALAPSREL